MAGDPIKHVVVLMLENRSFDHVLGALQAVIPGLDGVDPLRPGMNVDPAGTQVLQTAVALPRLPKKFDPKHEHPNVLDQLGHAALDMGGFVGDAFAVLGPRGFEPDLIGQQVMGFFESGPDGSLPALHELAGSFAVCDRWFSSVPGPTWPNRFFALSGTSSGFLRMPTSALEVGLAFRPYAMPTIFNRVVEAGRSCRIYHHGASLSMLLRATWKLANHYESFDGFLDAAQGDPGQFPEFAFIEPDYLGSSQNDQHPWSDIRRGDALLGEVYNALRGNDALWNETLLVVLYDEHGGFYDHVPPPATVAPDSCAGASADYAFSFDRLGVRVPALLVSPYIRPGVDHIEYDHTSLLRYLCNKWNLDPLGARCAQANSFGHLIGATPRTEHTPGQVTVHELPKQRRLEAGSEPTSSQQELAWAVDYMAEELGAPEPISATRSLNADPIDGAVPLKRKFDRVLRRLQATAGQGD